MMRPVVFKSKLFADPNFSDHPRSRKKLLWMLEALTRGDQEFLQDNPSFPSLFDPMRGIPGLETVEYIPEVTTEEWLDIETALDEGGGDCEDLAAWRCAELRNGVLLPDGRRLPPVKAMPHIKWRTMGDKSNRFHALVELPDGTIEDPSERLGMAKYNGYLSGKMPKDQVVAMLLREAEGAAQVGNLRASDTLKLRARQYWEENKDK